MCFSINHSGISVQITYIYKKEMELEWSESTLVHKEQNSIHISLSGSVSLLSETVCVQRLVESHQVLHDEPHWRTEHK